LRAFGGGGPVTAASEPAAVPGAREHGGADLAATYLTSALRWAA
jgi:hypothetical protein